MKRFTTPLAISLMTMLAAAPVAQAAVRVAVINPRQIIAQAPQAQSMRRALKERFGKQQQQLQSLQQQLQKEQKKFKKNQSIMSASEKRKTQAKLNGLAQKFRSERQAFVQAVRQARHKAFAKLDKRFSDVIRQVAKRNHDDIVLSQGIVYASDKVNITKQVLEQLRQKASSH